MNLSYFISKRITREQKEGFASTIHTIAIVIISVGLAAAIISFLVMKGFQNTVKEKIFSFTGHLLIQKQSLERSMEEEPFNFYTPAFTNPQGNDNIRHSQEYAHKVGIVKAQDEVLGVVLKGVGKSFDQKSFEPYLIEGKFIKFPDSAYSNQVVVSKIIADKLRAKVGDDLGVHFLQNPPRFRKLKIAGIYQTHLSEYFDSKIIIGDIRLIRRLNDWSDSLAGGVEIFLHDVEKVDATQEWVGESMDFDLDVQKISDLYMQVFEWLNLVSRQVNMILAIILLVICVNMVSIVLILVMERTQMIGMLKALGASNGAVRSVFIFQGMNLILKGLFWGNVLGLSLCFIQDQFKIVKLNPHDYYMEFVPISWNWEVVGLLNLLTFAVVTLVLLLPTMVISRINPIRAIRFD
ncbi:ABC transporter permease [Pseudochryseolinea flava]|nr:FtsX-like permease family protein [Pseudochryseolinea flava]